MNSAGQRVIEKTVQSIMEKILQINCAGLVHKYNIYIKSAGDEGERGGS